MRLAIVEERPRHRRVRTGLQVRFVFNYSKTALIRPRAKSWLKMNGVHCLCIHVHSMVRIARGSANSSSVATSFIAGF